MAEEAGKATIELTAENEQLLRQLALAEARIAELAAKANAADASGLGFKQSVGAVTSWVARVGGAVAIATGMFALGQRLRQVWDDFFTSGAEKARKFNEALLAPEASERLKEFTNEIEQIQARLSSAMEPLSTDNIVAKIGLLINGDTPEKLKEQLESMRRLLEGPQGAATAEAQRANEKRLREQNAEAALKDLEVRRERAKQITDEAQREEANAALQHEQRLIEIGRLGNSEKEKAQKDRLRKLDEAEQETAKRAMERKERERARDFAESVQGSAFGMASELARTDEEREEVAHQQRMLEIQRLFRETRNREEREAVKELLEQEAAVYLKHVEYIKQQRIKKNEETLRAIRDQQRQGFDLSDLADDAAGTGAVLQLINSAIARGGGR